MANRLPLVVVGDVERTRMQGLLRAGGTPQKVVLRVRIVLLAGAGRGKSAIAAELKTSRPTVDLWIQRYLSASVDGLLRDEQRSGRPKSISRATIQRVVEQTLRSKPPAQTHWSVRTMAKTAGVSRMTVQRIWKQHNLQPHRVENFKFSNDPRFVEKLRDVVGLYNAPPDRALVFSVDAKTQIQALDRTQPLLPLQPGLPERRTHDYRRNGTTNLLAALNMLDGKVLGLCQPRNRAPNFIRFLKQIEAAAPPDLELHLILDNASVHRSAAVKRWLKRHPRFVLHFTPTGCSWLNLIERWFSGLSEKRIRRGTFEGVPALTQAIYEYLDAYNQNAKPMVWTKSADMILEKVQKRKAFSGTPH